jgi:hypothetical protein
MFTFLHSLNITDWRDIVEITTFTLVIYAISAWLKKDRTRPLLSFFYGYCCALMICYALSLTVLLTILIAGAPILAMLTIIGHQEALQRRFVLHRKPHAAATTSQDWLETLIRFGLIAINQGKEWFLIIEHQHELDSVIKSTHIINAPITEEILSVIATSSRYQSGSLIWIKNSGIIHGFNAHWNLESHKEWHSPEIKDLPLWKQDALLMTLNTDAIVCKVIPDRRTFEVVIAGKIFDHISATQALALMRKHGNYQPSRFQEGIVYETSHSSSASQRTP